MADQINSSRRGFLAGAGALLIASPAIVRASSLMKVKQWQTFGPGGFLTIDQITKAFAAELAFAGAKPKAGVVQKFGQTQHQITSQFEHKLRTLSLEEFTSRILRPQAQELVKAGTEFGTQALPLPQGVHEVAGCTALGIAVRGVTDYNIYTDTFLTRFDVTVDK